MALNSETIRLDIQIRHAPQDVHVRMFDTHIKDAIITINGKDSLAKGVVIHPNGDVTFDFVKKTDGTE